MKGLIMTCDETGCKNEGAWAPRLMVPSKFGLLIGHRPLRVMTALHYCDLHRGTLKIEDILDGALKKRIEDHANRVRPAEWTAEFEKTRIEYVRVTTPEYRQFISTLVFKPNAGGIYAG